MAQPVAANPSQGIFLSAPGKIVLFGEHAVVYGRTAVAGSIDLRTYASLFTSKDGRIYLHLPDLGVEKTWLLKDLLKAAEKLTAIAGSTEPPSLEALVPVARKLSGSCEDQCGVQHLAILAFWYLLLGVAQRNRDLMAVKVTVCFELPSCVGLGSSGAYCVCIAAALLQASGLIAPPATPSEEDASCLCWGERDLDVIRRWASSAESLIHGRASGLDSSVCTHGGVASFRPGSRIEHIRNLPDLRVILVNSKVERNTSRMVATVKERLKKFPEVVEGIFNAIDAISKEATRILDKSSSYNSEAPSTCSGSNVSLNQPPAFHNSLPHHPSDNDHHTLQNQLQLPDRYSRLNELCRMNNQLLVALGVGHRKVDQICTILARYGIHPKMTGAGGGGSVFAFLKRDISHTVMEMIKQELTKLGYELWQPMLGGMGVVVHAARPDVFATPLKTRRKQT